MGSLFSKPKAPPAPKPMKPLEPPEITAPKPIPTISSPTVQEQGVLQRMKALRRRGRRSTILTEGHSSLGGP